MQSGDDGLGANPCQAKNAHSLPSRWSRRPQLKSHEAGQRTRLATARSFATSAKTLPAIGAHPSIRECLESGQRQVEFETLRCRVQIDMVYLRRTRPRKSWRIGDLPRPVPRSTGQSAYSTVIHKRRTNQTVRTNVSRHHDFVECQSPVEGCRSVASGFRRQSGLG